jgi:GH18 family chitinase
MKPFTLLALALAAQSVTGNKHLCEDTTRRGCLHLLNNEAAAAELDILKSTMQAYRSEKKNLRGSQVQTSTPSYESSTYIPNWATYYGYDVSQVPLDALTSINYAFIQIGNCAPPYSEGVCNEGAYATGEQNYQKVYATDPWSDFNTVPAGYNLAGETNGLANMGGVINLMHGQNKPAMVSLGGYTLSSPINEAIKPENRDGFVTGVLDFLETVANDNDGVTFDGLDLDWEPHNDNGTPWAFLDESGAADTLQNMLDTAPLLKAGLQAQYGADFLLTAAWPASPTVITKAEEVLPGFWQQWLNQMTGVNLMTYDYHGDFDSPKITNFNAPTYYDPAQPENVSNRETFNAQSTLEAYQAALNADGMQQLNLGIPFYGRGLADMAAGSEVCPGTYQTFSSMWTNANHGDGMFSNTDIEALISYGTLTACYDPAAGQWTAYGQEDDQNVWVSFDRDDSIAEKIDLAKQYDLGGAFSWSIDYDPTGELTENIFTALNDGTSDETDDCENGEPGFFTDSNSYIGAAAGLVLGGAATFFAQKCRNGDYEGYTLMNNNPHRTANAYR